MDSERFRRCERCGTLYDWKTSSSRYRRLSYCGYNCERRAEGFCIEDFDDVYREHVKGLPNDPEVVAAYRDLVRSTR